MGRAKKVKMEEESFIHTIITYPMLWLRFRKELYLKFVTFGCNVYSF